MFFHITTASIHDIMTILEIPYEKRYINVYLICLSTHLQKDILPDVSPRCKGIKKNFIPQTTE